MELQSHGGQSEGSCIGLRRRRSASIRESSPAERPNVDGGADLRDAVAEGGWLTMFLAASSFLKDVRSTLPWIVRF